MKVSGRTKVCAVIGDPVEHSLSPCFQNAAFQHLKLDFIYVAFTVKAESLGDAISGVRSLGIYGLNVTMPHKISVIKYLDELDERADRIKSVNTILNRNGKLIGYTTDGIGVLNALKYNGIDPKGKKVVILGAGGAARSASYALSEVAGELVILNRTIERARNLASKVRRLIGSHVNVKWDGLTEESLRREIREADILINATPVGMSPYVNGTLVEKRLLHPDMVVFDMIYHPLKTRLLREAEEVGAKTINGLSMLIHQGAASFEIWTGMEAPIDIMMKAAEEEIRRREGI
ncbi:shikimate dehydrogenase [Candidatus Bathyarchaeota archaeon]|nr:shikimate dehydrogenase [Candidatus Bathyarchaeota archaeon]